MIENMTKIVVITVINSIDTNKSLLEWSNMQKQVKFIWFKSRLLTTFTDGTIMIILSLTPLSLWNLPRGFDRRCWMGIKQSLKTNIFTTKSDPFLQEVKTL
jgi:hypothetical protein